MVFICLMKEEGVLEVAVSHRSSGNTLVVVIIESNELEYESLSQCTDMKPCELMRGR